MIGRDNWGWGISWGWSIGSRSWGIGWGRSISWCWGIGGWGGGMVSILVMLDQRLVRAGDSLILDISMILLVLIHKVVHNLNSAVWQLNSVLTYKTLIMLLLDEKR